MELARHADTALFIQFHVKAFEHLGGVPWRCLQDHAKVATLVRDEERRPVWGAAQSRPRAEHPWRDLRAPSEPAGWLVYFSTRSGNVTGGGKREGWNDVRGALRRPSGVASSLSRGEGVGFPHPNPLTGERGWGCGV